MTEILNINVWKVYVNYKTLFTERQCYIFMSVVQGGCALATSLPEDRSNNTTTLQMFISMAAEGKVNANNLVQTIVQHPAFRETINSIFTATYQEQSQWLLQLKSRNVRGASRHPAFMGNCLTSSHTCYPYLPRGWVLLVGGVNEEK